MAEVATLKAALFELEARFQDPRVLNVEPSVAAVLAQAKPDTDQGGEGEVFLNKSRTQI